VKWLHRKRKKNVDAIAVRKDKERVKNCWDRVVTSRIIPGE